ncbi:MAG: hypothetical protein CMM25_03090 [Rhodospirillaceae bacterium]|nr:hypothetical protein [Rhodospirillaceae bacterium]
MIKNKNPARPPDALIAALKKLLIPLVRLLISKGITLPVLVSILKDTFVEVAARDFLMKDKAQTDSRINVLTGVHRKDIKAIRGKPYQDSLPPQAIGLGAQIVSHWVSNESTTDNKGHPLPLARYKKSLSQTSFEELVQSISKDVRPRAVLDEWLHLGVAEINEQDQVVLNREAFIPEKGFTEKAFYFGRNLHDHIATTANNLAGKEEPSLERSVHFSKLSQAAINRLEYEAEKHGMKALLSLNRLAQEESKNNVGKGNKNWRFNFGLYFYAEEAKEKKKNTPDLIKRKKTAINGLDE